MDYSNVMYYLNLMKLFIGINQCIAGRPGELLNMVVVVFFSTTSIVLLDGRVIGV